MMISRYLPPEVFMEEKPFFTFAQIGCVLNKISVCLLGVGVFSLDRICSVSLREVRDELSSALLPFSKNADVKANEILDYVLKLRDVLREDAESIFLSDPSAHSTEEIMVCYPGFFAMFCHRIASAIYRADAPILARMISEYAHMLTGIDIHPGAVIGRGFAIDHGTGIVIGESAYIGNNVRLYHGVTLGALSFPTDSNGKILRGVKRHPSVMDNCTIYAGATILGGDTVIGEGSVIGAGCYVDCSLPPGTKYLNPLSFRHRDIFP